MVNFKEISRGVKKLGNVGNQINGSARHVYLSRDAGNTWEDIYTGYCAHNWTSQGSILVMSPSNAPTKYIRYSLNQGKHLSMLIY